MLTLKEIEFLIGDHDVYEATTDHLLHHADNDKNGVISKSELLQNYNVVMESQGILGKFFSIFYINKSYKS